eukprot:scaffold140516_cov36-Tisochrysis_lutea.AAC.1
MCTSAKASSSRRKEWRPWRVRTWYRDIMPPFGLGSMKECTPSAGCASEPAGASEAWRSVWSMSRTSCIRGTWAESEALRLGLASA